MFLIRIYTCRNERCNIAQPAAGSYRIAESKNIKMNSQGDRLTSAGEKYVSSLHKRH